MKTVRRLLLCTLCLLTLAMPVMADDEGENLEKDARSAEGTPPLIPHKVAPNATGEACLACHREGLNGAPATPHAERIDCVQCHAQGEIKKTTLEKKGKKHRKPAKGN